ncbi:1-acyl-sn-glycerol-3-phosphate acyltransferase [Flavobacterium agricola]|uniref:1-acyl-sn-glycerol-3-phosphate acyltransferase n=1 Tax=Flavobacterium agricola TaxID=2870839 RepID=A0ABY6LY32_9FLAO|nr:1-acyl-sn-glycerol-3-phosphate acyltransferase [Flavobacterium agricola]UYW01249.1 1-acyl-sn-glycerol-3-phosphate acyltransferase [Flavobacterium agricola]
MSKYDSIRFFYDSEVNPILKQVVHHPILKAMMNYTFPDMTDEQWKAQLLRTHSIRDFQANFIYHALQQVIKNTSEGLSTSGFEKLQPNTPYLFISNHRDIILDTSLLNVCLLEKGLVMTASAIGDNLLKKQSLELIAKLNRNFIIKRGLPPRELLLSSKLVSEYIEKLLVHKNCSVWIAQREGRTKDGNDATHQGVLKMIAMADTQGNVLEYFKKLKIVPVSISYEYDPSDSLKIPRLLAQARNEAYIKAKNEDFVTILSGLIGQKKHIHIHVGDVLDAELDAIAAEFPQANKQIQAVAAAIDDQILQNYKLWPTNFVAYDIVHQTNTFAHLYTEKDKQLFKRRLEMQLMGENEHLKQQFLNMYSNPVVNRLKYGSIE